MGRTSSLTRASSHELALSKESFMKSRLFHRAIAQSGSALNPWAFTRSSRDQAFKLGELLGCATDNGRELVSFLRSVPANSIIKAQNDVISDKEINVGLVFPFVPSLENDTLQAFLTESPMDLIKDGLMHEVPFILGITTHEGIIHIEQDRASYLQKVDKHFERLVPADLVGNRCPVRQSEISDKIRQFYFKDSDVSERTLLQCIDFEKTGLLFPAEGDCGARVWDGSVSLSEANSESVAREACKNSPCHADDLGYLFFSSFNNTHLDKDTPEMKVLALMVQLWTSFANNGALKHATDVHISLDIQITIQQDIKIYLDVVWMCVTLATRLLATRFLKVPIVCATLVLIQVFTRMGQLRIVTTVENNDMCHKEETS
ncbi:unnamed protein product [Timema podura]|uniref:Carboxylesterase type B domain-containing protein n=1 Tax=Timema podura TaxID=61482 RepID=A0ABN7NNH9_TIMPD|nr:unnamed protein product [Timema podura]